MKLIDKLFGGFSKKSTSMSYDQLADALDGAAQGGTFQIDGITVNRKTALQVAAVFGCVKAIADGCGTPDLHVYRRLGNSRNELAFDIPEYRLLSRRPNEYQTSLEWRRMMTLHAALTGTGMSIKVRSVIDGTVKELIPVLPGQWQMYRPSRYEMRWRIYDEFGLVGDFGREDLFILNGLQWDYGVALDAVKLARKTIGLAMATEKAHIDLHKDGSKAPGLYSMEGELDKDQYDRLSKHLKDRISTGDPLIMDRGGRWIRYAMSGVDAQHIETRRFEIEEICRVFGVFPIMVMHSDKTAAFASSEAFFGAHLKHTLMPWHKAWNQTLDEFMLDGSGPLYTGFDTRYLREGSVRDRSQFMRTVAEMGIYTRNEIRQEEGKDPLPGLDEPLTPMNMNSGQGANDDDND